MHISWALKVHCKSSRLVNALHLQHFRRAEVGCCNYCARNMSNQVLSMRKTIDLRLSSSKAFETALTYPGPLLSLEGASRDLAPFNHLSHLPSLYTPR